MASISLGTDDGETSRSLDRAIQKVIDEGVVVIAAAGNEAVDACNVSPAKGKQVMRNAKVKQFIISRHGFQFIIEALSNTGRSLLYT